MRLNGKIKEIKEYMKNRYVSKTVEHRENITLVKPRHGRRYRDPERS